MEELDYLENRFSHVRIACGWAFVGRRAAHRDTDCNCLESLVPFAEETLNEF